MSRFDFNFDFKSLRELHDSVNELLHSPDTKFEIINHGQEKLAHEVSEASLKMADSCSAAKDLLLLTKDHLQTLQYAFRRICTSRPNTAADHPIGNNFSPYRLPRKQLKKAILKKVDSLKGMKNTSFATTSTVSSEEDESLVMVVNMLKEVKSTTLLIVRSLLSLIAMPNPEMKPARKDPIFRLKLTRVDSLSFWEQCDVADIRAVRKRLEEVEVVLEEMEAEMERMFRRLIKTRASLLNIVTNN